MLSLGFQFPNPEWILLKYQTTLKIIAFWKLYTVSLNSCVIKSNRDFFFIRFGLITEFETTKTLIALVVNHKYESLLFFNLCAKNCKFLNIIWLVFICFFGIRRFGISICGDLHWPYKWFLLTSALVHRPVDRSSLFWSVSLASSLALQLSSITPFLTGLTKPLLQAYCFSSHVSMYFLLLFQYKQ